MPQKITLETLGKKTDQNFALLNKRLSEVDQRSKNDFKKLEKQLLSSDKNSKDRFDRLLDYMFKVQDKKIEQMNQEMDNNFKQNSIAHDQQLTILKRLDQERIFTLERVKNLEADVKMLKHHLGIN